MNSNWNLIVLHMNEYKGPNICSTCYISTNFNYTISSTEFCEFDVLDLIVVLAASKVATILLMVIETQNIRYSYTRNNKYIRIRMIITIYGRCPRRSDIDDRRVGTITNVIGCVFDAILHIYAFVDQINNQIVVQNEHCCNENTLIHSNADKQANLYTYVSNIAI